MKILDKLAILADAAKYDASCAYSGVDKRNSELALVRPEVVIRLGASAA